MKKEQLKKINDVLDYHCSYHKCSDCMLDDEDYGCLLTQIKNMMSEWRIIHGYKWKE